MHQIRRFGKKLRLKLTTRTLARIVLRCIGTPLSFLTCETRRLEQVHLFKSQHMTPPVPCKLPTDAHSFTHSVYCCDPSQEQTMNIKLPDQPPVAAVKPHHCSAHNVEWVDNYAWLRAENWQQAMREPELLPAPIAEYLQAENQYFSKAMAGTEALQEKLVSEMRGRMQEKEISLPDRDGQFDYLYKYDEGAEHPVYLRKHKDSSNQEVLLDINIEAQSHEYFDHDLVEHSPDHKMLAWSIDTTGAEYFELILRDLQTGTDLDYRIADVDTAAWADAQTLFYTRVDDNHRPNKVYRHQIGSDPSTDPLVYEETDERFSVEVETSLSRDYIFISTGMNDQDEVWFIPTQNTDTKPQVIEPRTLDLEYSVEHQNDRFLILTNADGAVDFKLVETKTTQPAREHWTDLVAHQPGTMIHAFNTYKNWITWLSVKNALPQISYMQNGSDSQTIDFGEEAYSLSLDSGYEFDTSVIRFDYSSPTTPEQTFEFNLEKGTRTFLKEQTIPSGHNRKHYITKRIHAVSHDGEQVPVTLLYHHKTPIDGTAPCLLYGYGSYGASIPAAFSGKRLSLVDRGFVYAIAHVRGGEEKGRAWYENAKLGNKPNTFHDFIAAAEALIEQQYTAAKKITIHGGSAGGLLVGAVLNMRPDLPGAAVADVPFVDVLNTILDDTLPLTPGEWSQWGNPIESRQAFEDIRGYSPYDNVCAQDYPPILVTAGVSDPRVTYWEPAKWVAKLRETKTDHNPLLLKTNMTSGHYGKTGRFAALQDSALTYAFAICTVGTKQ